jgi:hypothetical protein
MRQRLLLVAGWIVAAVGAGVVASGAVAIAGGQVFDRPIRPLNAAEVAALPVDESVATLGSSVRHASGGPQASTGVPSEGGGRDTTGANGSEHPAGPGGVPAGRGDPQVDFVRFPPTVTNVSGGTASISTDADGIHLLFATPRPHYAMGIDFSEENQLTVTFTSGDHRSIISIMRLDDGEIIVTTAEETIR